MSYQSNVVATIIGLVALLTIAPASAATTGSRNCKNTASFTKWLAAFKRDAAAAGVSSRTISRALSGIKFDRRIISRDRKQSFFSLDFLTLSGRMVAKYRINRGRKLIKSHAGTFARIKRDYGVPAPVIVAFWGLESDFGVNMGKDKSIRSIATLAYDCRRPELFRPELLSVLKIIDRGDLRVQDLIGSWAGELGQTQFLPSHYLNHGVDYDGDGRVNLLKSKPDVLASTGNFLKYLGWRRGEPWLQEVRVPANLPWDQADLTIRHPISQWQAWGVTRRNGKKLSSNAPAASLLLLMGRNGPAFLAYPNFHIYLEWNNSLIYASTAAYFATRLAGTGPVNRGRAKVTPFAYKQIRELQRLLVRRGLDVGGVDGKLGVKSRAAVKRMQKKYGLPADSYPTPRLLKLLRSRN